MTETYLNVYGKEYPCRVIKNYTRDEIHCTYGGELFEADFNQAGNVIKKILRAESFNRMCKTNCNRRKKGFNV